VIEVDERSHGTALTKEIHGATPTNEKERTNVQLSA
jgi:hypothetical protein